MGRIKRVQRNKLRAYTSVEFFFFHFVLLPLFLFVVFCPLLPFSSSLTPALYAQTELGSEDDLSVLGTNGSLDDPDVEIKGFTVFGSTQAAYTGAVVGPGNVVVNGYLSVSSGAYFVGNSTFTGADKIFINDGTPGQILRKNGGGYLYWDNAAAMSDSLGGHIATTTLNMNSWNIINVSSVNFMANVYISSASPAQLGGVYVSSNIYIVGVASAAQYYGDGSALTNVPGDSLGNHVATMTLQMGAYGIVTSSVITAARYQIDGSTVLAILPGIGSFAVGVDITTGNTGDYNLFVGSSAGRSNATGGRNSFLGYAAGYSNGKGMSNSFLGYYAGYKNAASSGTFVGAYAGQGNITGLANSFVGHAAGYSNTSGNGNSFLGYEAGYANTNGASNSYLGYNAGHNNSGGGGNAFLGYYAGYNNTASGNSLLGNQAGYANTTGDWNSFLGGSAGYNNSTGKYNSFLGAAAGLNNISGGNNTFAGYYAGLNNVSGSSNTVMGYYAAFNTKTGSANAIFGGHAGYGATNQSFSSSTIMGAQAGFSLTTGSDNILLGYKAGYNIQNGTGNIVIGYAKDTSANTVSNELNIGGVLYGDLSAKTIGISTRVPQAALDIVSTGTASNVYAQIWRNSDGVVKASMTADGKLYADLIASVPPGDNLGNHIATTTLQMGNFGIVNAASITANGYIATNSTMTVLGNAFSVGISTFVVTQGNVGVGTAGPLSKFDVVDGSITIRGAEAGLVFEDSRRVISSETAITLGAGIRISTNVYIVGFSSAAKYYGDGSGLTGAIDNLGSHVATTTLRMGVYGIVTSSDITAARYQIGGSTVLAILPGSGSFAVGADLSTGSTGNYNLFVGSSAGRSNDVGMSNTFIGNGAGYNNSSGNNNSFLGYQAGYNNISGGANSFLGNIAGYNNSSGVNNSFLGYKAGYNNTTASGNSFLGYKVGQSNTTGNNNSFFGASAGQSNTTGANNSFLGYQTGISNNIGMNNVFLGYWAGYNNTTGSSNTLVGYSAGYNTRTGSANAIFGNEAGKGSGANSFSSSTVMGSQAGFSLTTGSDNILLGFQAGYNIQSGTGNIVIGYAKDTSANTVSNELNIGGVLYSDLSAKTIGISTRVPQAALDIVSTGTASNVYAQIWRNSDGVIKASMTADGKLYADLIASVPPGDNLGNHIATTTLQMGNFGIVNVASITANGYIATNSTMTVLGNAFSVGTSTFVVTQGKVGVGTVGPLSKFDVMDGSITIRGADAGLVFEDSSRVASPETSATVGAGIRISTNVYLVGFSSAAKYYGDGSALTNVPGDNLGNHVATTTLQMGVYGIVTSSVVTAARYQIGGSTVLAILPGSGSFAVGVDITTGNTGNYNLFIGSSAGRSNTSGANNTFVGHNAGRNNTTSDNNTFVGYNAGKVNSSGLNNTFLGSNTGFANTAGGNNTFLGHQAGTTNTAGSSNTFVGYNAGQNNTTGGQNAALGSWAGLYNVTGSANAIFGEEAGYGVVNKSFSSSTLMGYRAGYGLTTGGDNILVGFQSGYAITTGAGNIVIGYAKDTSAPDVNNELNIGGVLYGDLSAKTIGISTRVPQAALDIVSTGTASNVYAQIWRNSNGVIKASMTADGKLYADIPGDSLGNHTATTTLNMAGFNIISVSTISVSSITTTAAAVTFSTNIFVMNGNVGIGTTNPSARLDIQGSGSLLKLGNTYMEVDNTGMSLVGRIQLNDDGSAGSPVIHWGWSSSDSNTGIFHPGPDILAFTTGGNELIRFNSSGNVGVGTTAPLSKFDVMNGSITIRGEGAGLVLENSSRVISSETAIMLGAGIRISTNVYIVGFSSAAKYYGDGSALTNVPGDNMGNHVATTTLNMNSWNAVNVSSVNFKSNVYISSASLAQSGGVYISTHVYIAGQANSAFFGYDSALVTVGSENGNNVTVSAQGGGHGAVGGTLTLTAGNSFDNNSIGGNVILQSGFGFPPSPGYIAMQTYEGIYPFQALAERLRIVGDSGNVGVGTTAPLSRFDVMDGSVTVRGAGAGLILENSSRVISPETSITAGAGIKISTNVYIVGFSSAAKYYGDGSELTNLPMDNLGNHVATTTLQMGIYGIVTSSDITAARYQINGSTVLAILPGSGSFAVGADLPAGNTGNYNLFIGSSAGRGNTGGPRNSFLGNSAGYKNTSGANNSFLGYNAGYSNTSGAANSFVGYQAGYNNTAGNYSTIVGYSAGMNSTGGKNSILGSYSGYNSIGEENSFMGYYAGNANTYGGNNTFMGNYGGFSNTAGGRNTFLGYKAGYYTQTGSANAIFGNEAGYGATGQSFSSSTLIGYQAGYQLKAGNDNILIGFQSGYNIQNGTGNIVIGYGKDTSAVGAINELSIGGLIYGDLSAKTIGISTRVPQAALDIVSTGTASNVYAQIWRNSDGVVKASMTADGKLYTTLPIPGDNLGNHVATTTLNMNTYNIVGVSTISVSSITTTAVGVTLSTHVYINGYVGIGTTVMFGKMISAVDTNNTSFNGSTLQYALTLQNTNPASNDWVLMVFGGNGITVSGPSAIIGSQISDHTNGYGNLVFATRSSATGFSEKMRILDMGDVGIGTTAPTHKLRVEGGILATSSITANGDITAARYRISGSTVLAILPGSGSFAVGMDLSTGSTGDYNLFIGSSAGRKNATGYANTFLGNTAGYTNGSGYDNTFLGYQTGFSNTTGHSNTVLGAQAGYYNTTGAGNSFVGRLAGYNNAAGGSNTFIGFNAGRTNVDGSHNTYVGYWSGYNTTGNTNSFLGSQAGYNNTTGGNNSIVGRIAGYYTQTGSANAIFGNEAGYGATGQSFSSSTIIGYQAGYALKAGNDNILIGYQAGYNIQNGTGNIIIGYGQNTSAVDASNELNIGGVLYGDLSAKTIGISTRVPQAALDIVSTGTASNVYAQIWRDSDGVIKASMTADGKLYTALPTPGDHLGNHVATTTLNMATFNIVGISTISVSSITTTAAGVTFSTHVFFANGNVGMGTTLPLSKLDVSGGSVTIRGANAALVFEDSSRVISSETAITLGAGVRVSTNVYIVGFSSAAKYYGDASSLTGTKDNLGNHVATTTLQMGIYGIVTSSDITAARYQINGSTVLAILPGVGSFAAGVNITTGNTGNYNLFVGYSAGRSNASGLQNAFLGYGAGYYNSGGTSNSFMGFQAGYINKGGASNTFLGAQTGYNNISGADNTFMGATAGQMTNTGQYNSFVGYDAGNNNTTGGNNSYLGIKAGYSNRTGSYNSIFGSFAGFGVNNNSFSNSTIMGANAGYSNTTGANNSIIGYNAAYYSETGSANAILGNEAGYGASGQSFSSATLLGYRAGYGLTTGNDNILIGFKAGYAITSGTGNIVIGYNKDTSAVGVSNELNIGGVIYGDLVNKTIGISTRVPQAALDIVSTGTASNVYAQIWRDSNGVIKASMTADGTLYATDIPGDNLGNHVATTTLQMGVYGIVTSSDITAARYMINGSTALAILPGTGSFAVGVDITTGNTGSYNLFVGASAGRGNTTGGSNTFAGWYAGRNNTTSGNNTYFGSQAGQLSAGSGLNVIVGQQAGYNNTGPYNTFIGGKAGLGNTSGGVNVFVGLYAGNSNNSGSNNTFFGGYAGRYNTTASYNIFIGRDSGYNTNTGGYNIFMGREAGYSNTTGSTNTIVGYYAGYYNQAGSANAIFGNGAGLGATGQSFSSSTIMGSEAGFALTTGSDNILMGFKAGYNIQNGTGNIVIGYNKDTSAVGASNELNIGGVIYGDLVNKTIGISTRVPQAALDIVSTGTASNVYAQIWRNSSGVIKASMTADGTLYTTALVAGDNLGNHVATTTLQMGVYGVVTSSDITAARYQINGSTVLAILPGTGSFAVGVDITTGNTGNYNLFVGSSAGRSNSTGQQNTFLGYTAGYNNSTGASNTFLGYTAGQANTTGDNNSFLGAAAGAANTSGSLNTAVGVQAGYGNTNGSYNSLVGVHAGYINPTGSANTIFGTKAGYGSGGQSFSSSTIMGYRAGYGLTTGSDNILVGFQAGYNIQDGTGNIVIGYGKDTSAISADNELNIGGVLYGDLVNKTIGISTRVPQAALDIVSTGTTADHYAQIWRNSGGVIISSMSATGRLGTTGDVSAARYQINGSTVLALLSGAGSFAAGYNLSTGSAGNYNLFVGYSAGRYNSAASYNTFVGYTAGYNTGAGQANTFMGYAAGVANRTGVYNVAVGEEAGNLGTSASYNVLVGAIAGYRFTTGAYNICVGRAACIYNQTGSANTVIGVNAAFGAAGGSFSYSTIMGYTAGYSITTGNDNLLLGYRAGYSITTGTGNIIIGYNLGTSAPAAINEINIGGVYKGVVSSGTATIPKFTVQAEDAGVTITTNHYGKTITVNSGSARTISLPASTTAADIGATITIVKLGAGKVTIDAGAGDYIADSGSGGTIYNDAVLPAYATITLRLIDDSHWVIIGGEGAWITTT